MNTLRVIYHLARADFLERVRRSSFLVTLLVVVAVTYFYLPALDARTNIAAYATWLGQFSVTGGCSATGSYGTAPAAPTFCVGDTVSVTFTLEKSDGSTWDIAFSRDPQQRYLYLADGKNEKVYVMDRQSLTILTEFGDGGRQPGMFYGVHSIATDSKGNIYTTETYEGKRVQKFVYRGLRRVTSKDQGAPWPKP